MKRTPLLIGVFIVSTSALAADQSDPPAAPSAASRDSISGRLGGLTCTGPWYSVNGVDTRDLTIRFADGGQAATVVIGVGANRNIWKAACAGTFKGSTSAVDGGVQVDVDRPLYACGPEVIRFKIEGTQLLKTAGSYGKLILTCNKPSAAGK